MPAKVCSIPVAVIKKFTWSTGLFTLIFIDVAPVAVVGEVRKVITKGEALVEVVLARVTVIKFSLYCPLTVAVALT